MRFSELIRGSNELRLVAAAADPEITGVHFDSRRVQPGFLFVAMRGEATDGNRYIDAAIQQGAVAVLTDDPKPHPLENVAWAAAAHGRRALAHISANFYGRPADKLRLIGVTGTNGKTTTTFLIESLLRRLGSPDPVLVGTIEYHVAGRVLPAPHTTPESLELNALFAEALAHPPAPQYAVMEASSHALEQERVYGLHYEVAVFTNLTRDHLDYHKTMAGYFASKQRLFAGIGAPPPRFAVINADDEYGRTLAQFARDHGSHVITYGIDAGDLQAKKVELTPRHTFFSFDTEREHYNVRSHLLGRVNVYNLLAAAASVAALGFDWGKIVLALADCGSVPGRFERVTVHPDQPFTVIVDYAHTDDALRNLTALARDFVRKHDGRVITLFGCGGDRDKSKRPLMGRAAGEGSDFVVLTSDNPRSEDPLAILADAEPGLQQSRARYTLEADRRQAIALAIHEARPGDIVLLAGKGHEKTQTTRDGVFPFDDVAIAKQVLLEVCGVSGVLARTSSGEDVPA